MTISEIEIKNQIKIVEELFKKDPKKALLITMGYDTAPKGMLASVIYAKVCEEVEKSGDTETSRSIANGTNNDKLSKEARELHLRDPHAPIELMKDIVYARRKEFEKSLPKGTSFNDYLNSETKKIKKEVDKNKLTKKDLEDFIDSL